MRPASWERIQELFDAAVGLAPDHRGAYLAQTCGNDEDLRQELESLLAAHQQTASFIQPPSLKPGARLGPYEVVSLLGRGGMGEVFRARDTRLGRDVALKLLPPALSADPHRVRRFEQEVRAASALNHPAILTVHDIGHLDGALYMVMELIEGPTLRGILSAGSVPSKELLSLAAQLAAGLAKAHAAGIVHRDLKPENVMVTPDGFAKILDFGLAKLVSNPADGAETLSGTGMVMGTVGYMSPEQARGEPVDFRSDQFSLGVVLYEMATGTRPSAGGPNSALPAGLRPIVERCLAQDPAQRYASTEVLARELYDLRDRLSGSRRRVPLRTGIGLAAVIMLGFLAGPQILQTRKPQEATPPPMLAVLPFHNPSGNPELDYLSDGFTEELLTLFARRYPGLGVIARTSAMRYKHSKKPATVAARELGVNYALTGHVQSLSERIRVTASLVNSTDESELWTETYDRPVDDLLEVQHEITSGVAGALGIGPAREQAAPEKIGTIHPEAYDDYLRGRFRYQGESRDEAIPLFERCLARQPDFALGHAALANAYIYRFFYLKPVKEWEEKAYVEVEKALHLDPGLADAYVARGNLLWTLPNRFPHERALLEYRRALDLEPNLAEAHVALGRLYMHIGLLDQALEEQRAAIRLDPTNHEAAGRLGGTLFFDQQYAAAIAQLDSSAIPARWRYLTAAALSYLGRHDEALRMAEELARAQPKEPTEPRDIAVLAMLLARTGQRGRVHAEIARVAGAARNETGYSSYHHAQYLVGSAYALLGENELAVEWLRRAAREGFPCYPFYAKDPNLRTLRGHVGFEALLGDLKRQWEHFKSITPRSRPQRSSS